MTILRTTLRLMSFAGLALFALFALIVAVSLPQEISHNSILTKSFSTAASWIDEFSETHGRLPRSAEYEDWAATKPKQFYGVQSIDIINPSSSDFYQEAIEAFGQPSGSNSYVLARWMGECSEYYASWARKSTVNNSPRFYGFILLLGVFFVLAACGCGYLASKLRPTCGSNGTA